jgi:hypothetical protein
MRRLSLLLPLAALLAIAPLLLHGYSCGHDFEFHIVSWLDAAHQLRQGTLYPHWAFSAAFNAGEPRFLFYPPLSWMLGEVLLLALPIRFVTDAYTWIALTLAGFAMYRLVREFLPAPAAVFTGMLYLANPYTLFTAYERTAYAELLAAAWMPLLLLAVLRRRPTIAFAALPIALLWLTNVPAAVMGCYAFATLALLRILVARWHDRMHAREIARTLVKPLTLGFLLGIGLAATYLLPVVYERRFVQVAAATGPGLSPASNFLFGHTADPLHDAVLRTASWIAISLLLALAMVLLLRVRGRSVLRRQEPGVTLPMLTLAIGIAFGLVSPSLWFWQHLPELAFLQFPWRFLAVLVVVVAAFIAFAIPLRLQRSSWLAASGTVFVLLLAMLCIHDFRQPCDVGETLPDEAANFARHHGTQPTDEYTVTAADNDVLRADDPSFWLTDDENGYATGTVPNPHELNPDSDDDATVPDDAKLVATPLEVRIHAPHAEEFLLNLRAYPRWQVTRDGQPVTLDQRDDGLVAVAVPAGESTIEVRWRQGLDSVFGAWVSILSALLWLWSWLLARRASAQHARAAPPVR